MHPEPSQVATIPIFSSLAPDQVEAVCRWLEVRTADPGERIVAEGAPGYFFLVIHDGKASVTRAGEQ
ncbi:MAG TPA: cyclic nucleotide-binding domain-containing protein, partial [Candidatus Dormibacteraeota bacterium]|nr:cyclic nucleotide-binding domain-containing protein [Candidatus Dormibacteraeota bacterium]